MTEVPSVMDKIRILRSNRRKLKPGQAKENAASVTMAPVTTPQGVFTKTSQQWVPFLVLDIGQPKDVPVSMANAVNSSSSQNNDMSVPKTIPLLTALPVPNNIPVIGRTAASSVPSTNNRTVIKTKSIKRNSSPKKSKNIPVACTIKVTSNALRNSLAKVKQNMEIPKLHATVTNVTVTKGNALVSRGAPVSVQNTLVSAGVPVSEQNILASGEGPVPTTVTDSNVGLLQIERENTTTLAPVGCVICDKQYPTLTEMQGHYLMEHKNRRSRESRKRNSDITNTETQKIPNLISLQDKADTDEPDLDIRVDEINPKCPVCSIAFKSALEVRNHVKLVHSYRCSECNETFYTLFEFTGHKCNKGVKKFKKIRKKPNRGSNLKPEVAKVMNNFVQIQPKNKKILVSNDVSPSLPALLPKTMDPNPISVSSYPTTIIETCNQGSELRTSTTTDTVYTENITSCNRPELSVEDRRTPSPTVTISPLEHKKTSNNIRVLETKNLRCFKFKKDEIVNETVTSVSKTEMIKEKLAQLKKNPHVSVSWIPRLRLNQEEDSEYVCGRCNVLCDDMEDYMDHIQDCLTITSVTLEPTSNPPQRILRLQKEVSSFGFQETNNNRYSINKNLINKLQAVLPQITGHPQVNSQYPEYQTSKKIGDNSSDLSKPLCQNYFEDFDSKGEDNKIKVESSLYVKEEPVDDYSHDKLTIPPKSEDVKEHGRNIYPAGNSKGTPPMVIIPVDQNCTDPLGLSKKATKGSTLTLVSDEPNSPASTNPSWESSPLDLLIDTDDIKMEVEEEIIDDNYED